MRGKDFFDRIMRDVGKFVAFQKASGATTPRVSLWLTGLKETVDQLPAFVRLAAEMGVTEVHLQRLVFDEAGYGMARADLSLFESARAEETEAIAEAEALACRWSDARRLGRDRARDQPEAAGGSRLGDVPAAVVADVFHGPRPGAALLHRAVLGARLLQLHAGRRDPGYAPGDLERRGYRDFRTSLLSDAPPAPCRNCGLRWSL